MKKLITFTLICLSLFAMGCAPATSAQFKEMAKSQKFNVEQDVVHEDTQYATKHGCRIIFYDKASASEAEALFDQTKSERKNVLQIIGSR